MQVNANTGYSAEVSLKVVFFGIERIIEPKRYKRYIGVIKKVVLRKVVTRESR